MSEHDPPERSVVPSTHPKHYRTHKYWARKPHNVVREYITEMSSTGDLVLDPFAGSGVTVIEALKAGRRGVAVDINPISELIIEGTLIDTEHSQLLEAFEEVKSEVEPEAKSLFRTVSPSTQKEETVTHVVWESQAPCPNCGELVPLESAEKDGRKSKCPNCGQVTYLTSGDVVDERIREVWYRDSTSGELQKKEPSDFDRNVIREAAKNGLASRVEGQFMHSNSRTLVHEGYTVDSYFTARNAHCLSLIASAIEGVGESSVEKVLKLAFTGAVAQASRLIPYRNGLTSGGPAWSVPGFWIPKLHFEINAWNCFENRFEKVVKGRNDLKGDIKRKVEFASSFEDIDSSDILVKNESSTNLSSSIPRESVDYIFTDPPYGDNVPYLEYSKIWYSWFNEEADFENEVVISDSSERSKDLDDYSNLLDDVFQECYRVLKKGRWMSLTFNNLDLDVWDALVSAILSAGFEFKGCLYQVPAVISSKAQLARAGSPIGDVILNFQKGDAEEGDTTASDNSSVKQIVLEEAERIIGERGGQARTEEIVRGVVVALLNKGKYGLSGYDISDILAERFIEEDSTWRFTDEDKALINDYPDLTGEIEDTVREALLGGADGEKQVMARVFSELNGKRTPSTARIAEAYEKISKELDESKQPDLFS